MVLSNPWPINKVDIFVNYKEKKHNMNKNKKNTDTKKKKSKKTKSSTEIKGGKGPGSVNCTLYCDRVRVPLK